MMRQLFIVFVLSILGIEGYTQNLSVDFRSPSDSLAIDSITATNLSTNQTITFPGNAILTLKDTLITHTFFSEEASSSRLFPNPSLQITSLQINSETAQKIKIKVTNLSGQTILEKTTSTFPGVQWFSISCKEAGCYLATIEKPNRKESIKFIQLHAGTGNLSLTSQPNRSNEKSAFIQNRMTHNDQPTTSVNNKSPYQLSYQRGNILFFRCKSGNYETVVTASPDSSITITPEFIKCIDADGNSYPIVRIGQQIWMAKNLTTTHYNNGDQIPSGIPDTVWVKLETGACAEFLKNPKFVPNYGRLYNWFAVNDERDICPANWHVSTNDEWVTLLNYLGGNTVAGGKLKATGTEFWKEPNYGADNSSGFSALPSSGRNLDGTDYNQGHDCFYWMADERDSTYAYNWYIYYNRTLVIKVFHTKVDGFAVRCVKDE